RFVGSVPAACMTHTSASPLRSETKAISVPLPEKAGTQSEAGSLVTGVGPEVPLAGTTQMSSLPERVEPNAIQAPSGDQAGLPSMAGSPATTRSSESVPSGAIAATWMSDGPPPTPPTYANWVPSGDHTPLMASIPSGLTRRASLPSARTIQTDEPVGAPGGPSWPGAAVAWGPASAPALGPSTGCASGVHWPP